MVLPGGAAAASASTPSGPTTSTTRCAGCWPATARATSADFSRRRRRTSPATLEQGWFFTRAALALLGRAARDATPRGRAGAFRDLHPEPRPDRQPRARRTPAPPDRRRQPTGPPIARCCCSRPQTPLLFMGQEWAASDPVPFFTDHARRLGAARHRGAARRVRARSASFASPSRRAARIPDPQAASRPSRPAGSTGRSASASRTPRVLAAPPALLALRRSEPRAARRAPRGLRGAGAGSPARSLRRRGAGEGAALVARGAPRRRGRGVALPDALLRERRFGSGGPCTHARTRASRPIPAPARLGSGRGRSASDASRGRARSCSRSPGRQPVTAPNPASGAAPARLPVRQHLPRCSSSPDFGFADAARAGAVPRTPRDHRPLHVALSSQRRPGSTHGYDISDHNRLNDDARRRGGLRDALRAALARSGHGHCRSTSCPTTWASTTPRANRWWWDVLENGPCSPYARFFDIDWDPVKRELRRQACCCRCSATSTGACSSAASFSLAFEAAALVLHYFERQPPDQPAHVLPAVLRHGLERSRGEARRGRPRPARVPEHPHRARATCPTIARDRSRRASPSGSARRRWRATASRGSPRAHRAIREHVEASVRRCNGRPGDADELRRRFTRCSSGRRIGSPTGAPRSTRSTTGASSTSTGSRACAWRIPRCSTATHALLLRLVRRGPGHGHPPRPHRRAVRPAPATSSAARSRARRAASAAAADGETGPRSLRLRRGREDPLAPARRFPTLGRSTARPATTS